MPVHQNVLIGASGQGGGGYVIEGSGSFNGTDGKLTRTISSAGNRKTFILEVAFKRGGSASSFLTAFSSGTDTFYFYLSSDQVYIQDYLHPNNRIELKSDAKLRDFSAWYHLIVAIDTTQGTDTNRVKAWLNGVELTWAVTTYPTQNLDTKWNTGSQEHQIGHSSTTYSSDYFARAASYDGLTMTDPVTDEFGKYDENGNWTVLDVSGKSFGTTGFLIEGGTAFTNGTDSSGNSQNFTKGGTITNVNDTLTDSDNFGNYATLNPLTKSSGGATTATISEGNTRWARANDGSNNQQCYGTFGADAGKFYFEFKLITANNGFDVGLFAEGETNGNEGGGNAGYEVEGYYLENYGTGSHAWKVTKTGQASGGAARQDTNDTAAANDICKIAVDFDAGKIWLGSVTHDTYYSGSDGSDISFSTGSPTFTFTAGTRLFPYIFAHAQANDCKFFFNPGEWTGSAPSGFLPWTTANLPAPTVTKPSDFFKTVLFSGTGSAQNIDTVGFSPDLLIIKSRTSTANFNWIDRVRGEANILWSNAAVAQSAESTSVTGFRDEGFSVGSDSGSYVNISGQTMVAFCMKAGGSGSSNSDGDIASTVSVASHGGFSIVKYDPGSGGSPGDTVGHGLSRTPNFIILKALENVGDTNWRVGSDDIGWTNNLFLNLTLAASAGSGAWNNTVPGSSVFTIGSDTDNDAAYIAYCFAKTPGLIACGSYTGNNDADGTYVVVDDGASGFRPAWLLMKNINDSENWVLMDSVRSPFNPVDGYLSTNTATSDTGATGLPLDFTANGFKQRNNSNMTNEDTIIYLAFAEHPFGGDGVAQARAR